MENNTFLRAFGISYAGTLPKIKKSNDQLRPIFEAFTNSLEAIRLSNNGLKNNHIKIKFIFKSNLFSKENGDRDLEEIVIEDSGIGFTEKEFEQMENLNDTRKGFFNKGSGRIQFLHSFDKSEFQSIYKDETSKTEYKERIFTLSKSDIYLNQNAILFFKSNKDIKSQSPLTKLTFKNPLIDKDREFYETLSIIDLKEKIISHYLAYFCENRNDLPTIDVQYYEDKVLKFDESIHSEDIPEFDKQENLSIYYSKISSEGKVELSNKKEIFNLKAFKIDKDKLEKNGIKFTSKGEIANDLKIENLLAEEFIDGKRYLFLISSKYIDDKDTDTRGKLNIPTLEEFKKSSSNSLFNEEEILLDNIQVETNENILSMYNEIKNKKDEKIIEVEKLKNMFLLNSITLKEVKITLNDSEEEILEKVYKADAKIIAKKDAEIKKRVDALDNLDPSSDDFNSKFIEEINELTKSIPLQNRTQLTQYVARRKLVLELFEKILNKKLIVQKATRNEDEKLLHNLIFQQRSNNTLESDLWVVNEDFVYFDGTSEGKLGEIEYNGSKIMKENLNDEEIKYRDSLEEKRYEKRPDVLLFPDEGKCIIIEFKNPNINVSDHILQINNYASLIRNLSNQELNFDTFYGYLVGEKLDADDIQNKDSAFIKACHFDYVFKPYYRILGKFGKIDGSLYTEAITYSNLLKRARKRNELFINKLIKPILNDI